MRTTVYGDYAVLPTSGELTTSPGAGIGPYAVSFDHSKEEAHPGYYAITLANGVRVEITVAERSGIARFIFPEGANARLLVNAGSSANTVQGHDPLPTGNEAYGKPDRAEGHRRIYRLGGGGRILRVRVALQAVCDGRKHPGSPHYGFQRT